MKIKQEDIYLKFLEENIPNSNFIKTQKTTNVYSRVVENILVTEIFKVHLEKNNVECYLGFYEKYEEQFKRILLYIGINDYNSVAFCIRSLIENLLRFIYSMYIRDSEKNISNISFRNMKEQLSEFNKFGLEMNIDNIMKLCSIYARYSNDIHGKTKLKSSVEYIEGIIQEENIELRNIDSELTNILNIYEELFIEILEIKNLSTNELISLKKSLSNNRFKKLYEKFYRFS